MKDIYSFDDESIPFWIKALFWVLYMVVFIYAVRKVYISAPKDKRKVEVGKLIVFYFAAYAVFYCVNPDYFRYREWMRITDFRDWGKEIIYIYFIVICRLMPFPYRFEIFRLIVWGGALLLVWKTAKLYRGQLMPGLVVMLLFVFYSSMFCYARASLAMAVYFFGVVTYLCGENPWRKTLGIALALSSYMFHHEMIIGIAVLPFILFPSEKKKTNVLSLILLVVFIIGVNILNSDPAFLEEILGSDDLLEKIEKFNAKEQRTFRMSTFVSYLTIFYPFLLITKFFRRQRDLPKPIAGIYRITFVILLATIAFFVVSGSRSTYTYRVLFILIIPMAILISYCYNQGLFKKYQFAIMLLLALLSNSVRLINAL